MVDSTVWKFNRRIWDEFIWFTLGHRKLARTSASVNISIILKMNQLLRGNTHYFCISFFRFQEQFSEQEWRIQLFLTSDAQHLQECVQCTIGNMCSNKLCRSGIQPFTWNLGVMKMSLDVTRKYVLFSKRAIMKILINTIACLGVKDIGTNSTLYHRLLAMTY